MQKISIKLNKDSLSNYKTSSYKNKDGVNVEQYDLELVMQNVKEIITEEVVKIIKSSDTWEIVEAGFVAGRSIKQDDGKYTKEPIFGNATIIRDKKKVEDNAPQVEGKGYEGEVTNIDDIPF